MKGLAGGHASSLRVASQAGAGALSMSEYAQASLSVHGSEARPPRPLERELNEAFASQCLHARDRLGVDNEKYNVSGGSIAVGHRFGMTGARCSGHILQEDQRRGAPWGMVTICISGGQGAAGLFEIYS